MASIRSRSGSAASQAAGSASGPPAAPRNMPARQATESLSPEIRAPPSIARATSPRQRRAAATARPRALGASHPPGSWSGIASSSSQGASRAPSSIAAVRARATSPLPPRDHGPPSASTARRTSSASKRPAARVQASRWLAATAASIASGWACVTRAETSAATVRSSPS